MISSFALEESLSAAAETPPAFLLALRDTQTEAVVDEEQCFLYSIVYSAAVYTTARRHR